MNGQQSMFGPKRDCLFYVDNGSRFKFRVFHICGEELCELRKIRIRDPNGNYVCDNCHNYKKFVIGGYFDHER